MRGIECETCRWSLVHAFHVPKCAGMLRALASSVSIIFCGLGWERLLSELLIFEMIKSVCYYSEPAYGPSNSSNSESNHESSSK